MNKDYDFISIMKFAGAFVAFMIGSGYATGQEIMQFFTGYGYYSIGAITISLILFSFVGSRIMVDGFDNKSNEKKSLYSYYCGRYLGVFFDWFVVIFLFAVVVIMISGAGATIKQYLGLQHFIGAAIMAILVLVAYLLGLKKLIDMLGAMGPILILFTLIVGFITIIVNSSGLANIEKAFKAVTIPTASRSWVISGFLYASFALFGSVPFFNALGKSSTTRKNALYGGIAGGAILMIATFVMNLGLLSKIDVIHDKQIPTLVLANDISPVVGFIFSIILIIAIFSTAAPMFWTVCDKIKFNKKSANIIFAVIISIAAFLGGLLPFGKLVGTIYPYTGYMGLLVMACITFKFIQTNVNSRRKSSTV